MRLIKRFNYLFIYLFIYSVFVYYLLSETSSSNIAFIVLHDYVELHALNFPIIKWTKWLRNSQWD